MILIFSHIDHPFYHTDECSSVSSVWFLSVIWCNKKGMRHDDWQPSPVHELRAETLYHGSPQISDVVFTSHNFAILTGCKGVLDTRYLNVSPVIIPRNPHQANRKTSPWPKWLKFFLEFWKFSLKWHVCLLCYMSLSFHDIHKYK